MLFYLKISQFFLFRTFSFIFYLKMSRFPPFRDIFFAHLPQNVPIPTCFGHFPSSSNPKCPDSLPFWTFSLLFLPKLSRSSSHSDIFFALLPQTVPILSSLGHFLYISASKCPNSSLIRTFSLLFYLKMSQYQSESNIKSQLDDH